jgi:hypothetical protein
LVRRENAFDELDIDERHVRLLEHGWPELAGVQRLPGMSQPPPVQELNRPDSKTELAWHLSLA